MKTILFILFSTVCVAQGVDIPLQKFTLQVPNVNTLSVSPVGAPRMDFLGDTAQKVLVQDVYYKLLKDDGRTVEAGTKTLPMQMYYLIFRYVDGTITASDISTINHFFQLADWPLTAVMPVKHEE